MCGGGLHSVEFFHSAHCLAYMYVMQQPNCCKNISPVLFSGPIDSMATGVKLCVKNYIIWSAILLGLLLC